MWEREFTGGLARTATYREAKRYVAREGGALWRRAVDRAQGRGPAGGDLSRDDDRPLYWARLGMTKALRAWQPGFEMTGEQRAALADALERGSRGQDSIALPAGKRVVRIVVTGFDPFQLDDDARRSNPSGAAALALDGTTVRTASGRSARIETAVFPVRWADFADGTVERTLLPHFRHGPRQADLFTTISQGRPGRFDVERTNGAWRGNIRTTPGTSGPGPCRFRRGADRAAAAAVDDDQPAVRADRRGRHRPWPVVDHTAVTEIPAGGTGPVDRPDGPTPGSTARAGGGGDYLSNEIAYRATLLRDAVRPEHPRRPSAHPGTGVRPRQHRPGRADHRPGFRTEPRRDHRAGTEDRGGGGVGGGPGATTGPCPVVPRRAHTGPWLPVAAPGMMGG